MLEGRKPRKHCPQVPAPAPIPRGSVGTKEVLGTVPPMAKTPPTHPHPGDVGCSMGHCGGGLGAARPQPRSWPGLTVPGREPRGQQPPGPNPLVLVVWRRVLLPAGLPDGSVPCWGVPARPPPQRHHGHRAGCLCLGRILTTGRGAASAQHHQEPCKTPAPASCSCSGAGKLRHS